MSKVSVIIPTYNREKLISKCIDTLLCQTLNDVEIIIIDDGSTDNTSNIISKYTDKRVKYVKRTNHGIGNSRNYGLDISSGEYIIFVDSDDYLEYNALEKMYNKAINEKLDIVVSDFYNVYLNGKKEIEEIRHFENTKLIDNPNLLLDINLGPCNKLYKNNLFKNKKMRFPEDIKYEDMPLVSNLLKCANSIGHIDEPLCDFLIDNTSETTVRDERIFDIFKSLDMTIDNFNEKEYQETLKELVISKLCNYIIQQRYQKDKQLRHKFIDDAFIYMKKMDNNYKNNPYFKKRNRLKVLIEKHKFIAKLYCDLYIMIKK